MEKWLVVGLVVLSALYIGKIALQAWFKHINCDECQDPCDACTGCHNNKNETAATEVKENDK